MEQRTSGRSHGRRWEAGTPRKPAVFWPAQPREAFLRQNLGSGIIGTLAVLLVVSHFWPLPLTAIRVAGLVILIPSFVLLITARIQLGRAFSLRPRAKVLVTTGLYARIRNPIYLFGALGLAGLTLWADRPKFLLVFLIVIPVQAYRSRQEQRVLAARFGTAYTEYKKKTWF